MDHTFESFMKGNVAEVPEEEVVVSSRFPAFRVRAVTPKENDEITEKCRIRIKDKHGRMTESLNVSRYTSKLTAAGVAYPDLNNAALLDSYGVNMPDELLQAMLTAGEFRTLQQAVQHVSGFDVTMDEEVETAKN